MTVNVRAVVARDREDLTHPHYLRNPLDKLKPVTDSNDLSAAFRVHFLKGGRGYKGPVGDLSCPCPRLKDKVLICVIDPTGTTIRVMDEIKELTAGPQVKFRFAA